MDIEGFKLDYITKEDAGSPQTAQNYAYMLGLYQKEHPKFDLEHVKHFLQLRALEVAEQKRSASSYNKFVKAFKAYCKFVHVDPPEWLKKRKERRKPPVPIFTGEIQKLINLDTKPMYNIFWKLAAHNGFRPKEIRYLTIEDVTERTITIRGAKTETGDRVLWLPKAIRNELVDYMRTCASNFLFPSPVDPSKPISHASLAKDWNKRLKILEIHKKAKPYSLRHGFGTRNAQRNIVQTKEIMGHSSITQTMEYVHQNLDAQKKFLETDPLTIDDLPPEEHLRKLVEDMQDAGVFDSKKFSFQITESSLHIEVRRKKV